MLLLLLAHPSSHLISHVHHLSIAFASLCGIHVVEVGGGEGELLCCVAVVIVIYMEYENEWG